MGLAITPLPLVLPPALSTKLPDRTMHPHASSNSPLTMVQALDPAAAYDPALTTPQGHLCTNRNPARGISKIRQEESLLTLVWLWILVSLCLNSNPFQSRSRGSPAHWRIWLESCPSMQQRQTCKSHFWLWTLKKPCNLVTSLSPTVLEWSCPHSNPPSDIAEAFLGTQESHPLMHLAIGPPSCTQL